MVTTLHFILFRNYLILLNNNRRIDLIATLWCIINKIVRGDRKNRKVAIEEQKKEWAGNNNNKNTGYDNGVMIFRTGYPHFYFLL